MVHRGRYLEMCTTWKVSRNTPERRGGTNMIVVYLFSLAAVDIYALDAAQYISHTAARI